MARNANMLEKATALILVLVVMIIVGLGTAALLQAMLSYSQMKIVTIENTKARYLTEAGIQYGLWQCGKGDFTSPVSINTEEYAITITKTVQDDGSYEVRAEVEYAGI